MPRTPGVSKAGRVYSNKPAAVKRRITQHTNMLEDDITTLYQKPIEDWDFQELQCGRPRRPDGTIRRVGKKPRWISPAIANEVARRLQTATSEEIGKYAGEAIKTMIDLMQNARTELVRFQAAQFILQQIVGLPKQKTEIEGTVNVAHFLADVMRNPGGEEFNVIEGTIVDSTVDQYEDEDDDEEVE